MRAFDISTVVSGLSSFSSYLSLGLLPANAMSLRQSFLLKRQYTGLLFRGFSSSLTQTSSLPNVNVSFSSSSRFLTTHVNLLRSKLFSASLRSVKNIKLFACNFFLKSRQEIAKRIRSVRYKMLRVVKSKNIILHKP